MTSIIKIGKKTNISYLTDEHVALNSAIAVFWLSSNNDSVFAVFLVFSLSGGSLGTTTSPQQQDTAKLKDLCEVWNSYSVLADIFGSRAVGGKKKRIKVVCNLVYIVTIKMPALS